MGQLEGKVAIITGASSGIGEAAAMLFAREGASVVLNARRKPELEAVAAKIAANGGKAAVLAGSAADEEVAEKLVALALKSFGRLDVAFNNAGILGEMGPSTGVSLKAWNEAIAINLTGAFLGAKHQIPAMLKSGGGSVIFTSTFVGYSASFPGAAAYAASVWVSPTRPDLLAAEFGSQGIRVNALLPGAVDTPMYRAMNSTADAQQFINGLHALKRAASAEELARSALYLASDASSFTTGSAMLVDGGISITRT
jgi:NAD(P)-dependent dehydrogenase (short-subunit alcohol dehydrogenase family)